MPVERVQGVVEEILYFVLAEPCEPVLAFLAALEPWRLLDDVFRGAVVEDCANRRYNSVDSRIALTFFLQLNGQLGDASLVDSSHWEASSSKARKVSSVNLSSSSSVTMPPCVAGVECVVKTVTPSDVSHKGTPSFVWLVVLPLV